MKYAVPILFVIAGIFTLVDAANIFEHAQSAIQQIVGFIEALIAVVMFGVAAVCSYLAALMPHEQSV